MSEETIKSVRRAFEILEYFDEVAQPLSLNEVARHFRYPMSSTAAMLKSMMLLGYLNYDAAGRTYMPTPRLPGLGEWAKAAFLHQDVLLAGIERLKQRTGETVAVAAQSDFYVQYLHVSVSDEELQVRISPGTLRPITGSAMGWILLGAHNDETIELLWRRCNRAKRSRTPVIRWNTLMQHVAEARTDGYVISRHSVTPGVGAIAMLLPGQFFGRPLAVCIGGPVWRLDEKQELIVREMRSMLAQFPREQKRLAKVSAEAVKNPGKV